MPICGRVDGVLIYLTRSPPARGRPLYKTNWPEDSCAKLGKHWRHLILYVGFNLFLFRIARQRAKYIQVPAWFISVTLYTRYALKKTRGKSEKINKKCAGQLKIFYVAYMWCWYKWTIFRTGYRIFGVGCMNWTMPRRCRYILWIKPANIWTFLCFVRVALVQKILLPHQNIL